MGALAKLASQHDLSPMLDDAVRPTPRHKIVDVCGAFVVAELSVEQKQFGGLGLSELRELKQLRNENRKLRSLVADLTLARQA